jgi:hypothetical protein
MPKLTLVDDRVASGLANNQIGPLHHDDRHEKGRVAGVFQLLTGVVSLSIIRREIQYSRCCATWRIAFENLRGREPDKLKWSKGEN